MTNLKSIKQRTIKQNKAIHLMNTWIANQLNDAGLDIRKVLKPGINIPWTQTAVKELLVKPIMKVMYQKDSTTELNKSNKEIEHLYDCLLYTSPSPRDRTRSRMPSSA